MIREEHRGRHLILLPTYNEKENMYGLLDALCALGEPVDVLVIDDSSPDGTREEVMRHPAFSTHVFLLLRQKKEGLGTAYRSGFAWGLERAYETFIQMDADFSHQPSDVPRLISVIQNGADVAIGSRRIRGGRVDGWGWWRRFCSFSATTVSRVCLGLHAKDVTAGFRAWRRSFIQGLPILALKSNGYAFQEEMLFVAQQARANIVEIPVVFMDREKGSSKLGIVDIWEFFFTIARLTVVHRRRFAVYTMVGAFGALVDFTGFIFFHEVVGWELLPANIIATSIALLHNFFWHHFVTFKAHGQVAHIALTKFFIVSVIGMALNSFVVVFLVSFGFLPLLAKVFAIACVAVWNYTLNSRVTFSV